MKKKHILFAIISVFAIWASTLVFAAPVDNEEKSVDNLEETTYGIIEEKLKSSASTTDVTIPESVRIKGVWGYMDDREPDGYFGGKITRKGRFAVFHGLYNETGSEERMHIVGIMKKGYFNGRITTDDGSYRVTGLYRIDMEKHIVKLKWMTARKQGWAIGRIKLQ